MKVDTERFCKQDIEKYTGTVRNPGPAVLQNENQWHCMVSLMKNGYKACHFGIHRRRFLRESPSPPKFLEFCRSEVSDQTMCFPSSAD